MAPEVEARRAGPGEQAHVASLIAAFRDFCEETSPPDQEIARMVAELFDDPRTEFLLAGDPAVGVAQLRFRPSVWTGTEDAWLEDVFVIEDARQGGTGRMLVEACVDLARARGCKRIQLDVSERNEPALDLYESLGFHSTSPKRWEGGRLLCLTRRL